ncbi:MAG: hypothetical protein ACRENL_11395 [Candidatus Dormibacteria bacterium]
MPRRRHALDESFFERIDSEPKAYWLGVLIGDGWVGRYSFTLGLADEEHVRAFRDTVAPEAPLRWQMSQKSPRPQWSVTVCSVRMIRDLARHGFVPGKPNRWAWQGRLDLQRHFWRGVVDADGALSAGPQWCLTVSGHDPILRAFAAFAHTFTHTQAVPSECASRHSWQIRIGGRRVTRAIVELLYKGATVELTRKAALAAAIIATPTRRYRPGEATSVSRGCSAAC